MRFHPQRVLKKFIDGPTNGSGGHLVEYPCRDSLVVPHHSMALVNGDHGIHHSRYSLLVGEKFVLCASVQEGLGHVERVCDRRGKCARPCSTQHVRGGVVLPLKVEVVLEELVTDKVCDLKGNVHAKLCGVAAIECLQPFFSVYSFSTVQGSSVGGIVDL